MRSIWNAIVGCDGPPRVKYVHVRKLYGWRHHLVTGDQESTRVNPHNMQEPGVRGDAFAEKLRVRITRTSHLPEKCPLALRRGNNVETAHGPIGILPFILLLVLYFCSEEKRFIRVEGVPSNPGRLGCGVSAVDDLDTAVVSLGLHGEA